MRDQAERRGAAAEQNEFVIEGEPADLLRTYGRTPVRRWRYEGVHGIRQADLTVGTMPDAGWFAYSPKLHVSHVFPDEASAVEAAQRAMDAYATRDEADPYGGKGPTGHQAGRWVETPPSLSPRITYGEKPGERDAP